MSIKTFRFVVPAACAALALTLPGIAFATDSSPTDSGRSARHQPDPDQGLDPGLRERQALREARQLLAAEGLRSDAAVYREIAARGSRFDDADNVFLPNTIALVNLENPDEATVVLPLFAGDRPGRKGTTQFIITETSDFTVARLLGVNYAPALALARGTGGDQRVTLRHGRLQFRGDVDFGPELSVTPGVDADVVPGTTIFPPSAIQPGAVADAKWSSIVSLPSGLVLNVGAVHNSTGVHDRVVDIDVAEREVTVQLLDGMQGGDQYYYHLVTDASDPVAATLEEGIYSPRLAELVGTGLPFSPNINGIEERGDLDRQGLNSILSTGGLDPINVFPLDPDNDAEFDNIYSPLWDAHVNQWTQEAIDAGLRRRITGFDDLQQLITDGHVESGAISPPGEGNPFVFGLRSTGLIINCPVIVQPFEGTGRRS